LKLPSKEPLTCPENSFETRMIGGKVWAFGCNDVSDTFLAAGTGGKFDA
jgi:hypothetical protein